MQLLTSDSGVLLLLLLLLLKVEAVVVVEESAWQCVWASLSPLTISVVPRDARCSSSQFKATLPPRPADNFTVTYFISHNFMLSDRCCIIWWLGSDLQGGGGQGGRTNDHDVIPEIRK